MESWSVPLDLLLLIQHTLEARWPCVDVELREPKINHRVNILPLADRVISNLHYSVMVFRQQPFLLCQHILPRHNPERIDTDTTRLAGQGNPGETRACHP